VAGGISHIIFTIKNSRYDWQKIRRKKSVGFIAPTYSFFEGNEEEIIINFLAIVASELNLKIAAFNFCGDHVHALIIAEIPDIPIIVGRWKGKSAFLYNHKLNSSDKSQYIKNTGLPPQSLWAKSYYQNIITSNAELEKVIHYIKNNRVKHGLKPLPASSEDIIKGMINQKIF